MNITTKQQFICYLLRIQNKISKKKKKKKKTKINKLMVAN